MYLIKNSCIRVPAIFEKEKWCQIILSDLRRADKDYNTDSIVTKSYYIIRDGNILIPRYYNIERHGHKSVEYLDDGLNIQIKFTSKLRSNTPLQQNAVDYLTTAKHGVLCMQPGEGKTVVAIAAICELKKKAIIYVHKDSLATQWKERFLQHSSIKEDSIGMLSSANARDVLKSKQIIITTVQTMNSMIKRMEDIEWLLANARFGIAFWDECHTSVAAETFSLSSMYLPCKRTFGLSATPTRSDNNTDIIEKHLGKIFVPDGSGNTIEPKIIALQFDHGAIRNHKNYIYMGRGERQGWRFDRGKYLQMLTSKTNKEYVSVMAKICKQIYGYGRTIIFLSDRIKVLDQCSAHIPKHDKGFFIPRSGKKRDDELKKKFVFSTYGSARDGTDKASLDCLVMATPTSNLEQCIGRVVRAHPNKDQPIVFDVVDTGCDEMLRSFNKRLEFYKKKNWTVEIKNIKK